MGAFEDAVKARDAPRCPFCGEVRQIERFTFYRNLTIPAYLCGVCAFVFGWQDGRASDLCRPEGHVSGPGR